MSAPQLTLYGPASVFSPDGMNTFEQTCDTFSDMRSFFGAVGQQLYSRGGAAIADGDQGVFYWNATITNPVDNNLNTIVPTGSTMGAWIRIPIVAQGAITATSFTLTSPAGTATDLDVIAPSGQSAAVRISGASGGVAGVYSETAGADRWYIGKSAVAETGGNVGSDFIVNRYNDAGSIIDFPLFITRATGIVSMPDGAKIQGPIGLFGSTPTGQPSNTGATAYTAAGSVGAVFTDTTFTGGLGGPAYTIGQLVYAMKLLGAIE